jgi:hypothetical protein
MNEIEQAFQLFLKDWKLFNNTFKTEKLIATSTQQQPEILERRLTVVPHNSWRVIGSQSFVSLNKEINGVI